MLELKGYEISEKLKENGNSTVFRGKKSENGAPIIIKWRYSNDNNFQKILRSLKNEFDIMNLFSSDNIIKAYELLETRDGCGLIIEDFGGRALLEALAEEELGLELFLTLGISLTDTLGRVHQKDVIHKDINPRNVIVNTTDWDVKLSDFGIASLLSRDEQALISPERLEGTLSYISPEQTGRMNRSIDYRTDIYSLGVTFYEMLCGELPFQAQDAVGWVNNHIAVTPVPPHEKKSNIPVAVSAIILKMMEKNAEDRYQSAFGVKGDLEECLALLKEHGRIEGFTPGAKDVSGRFQIPQKLYGRDAEIQILLEGFDSAVELANSEILLVSGYSGIGKSVLVREIHRPIVERRGYFFSGKYDQFKRNIPYSALIQAFQELLFQLVSESEESLNEWRRKLLEALGPNGQVIIDVIPEVELIIGPQPAVIELEPADARGRFNITFQKFIKVFTRREHPLVLFLDDLQWADSASLNLIKVLMSDPDIRYLFLIGAYRDNEVSPTHPFIMLMDELKGGSVIVNSVNLKPLKPEDVEQLVAESLQSNDERGGLLAKVVMEMTEGNPFFVNEFLKTLIYDELLTFDPDESRWVFDVEEIKAKGITNNVVELMVSRMEKMPAETQEALQLASCVGNIFDLKTLALVSDQSPEEAAKALWPAVNAGMLIPLGESRELLKTSREAISSINTTKALKATERFQHDRVQQAAYAMLDESQKEMIHLKIGRILYDKLKDSELEEKLFDVVGQLNDGRALITEPQEILRLGELNLRAGKKAKASAAFQPALNFLTVARELLPEKSWKSHYELTRDVYLQLAETANITTEFELLEEIAELVLQNAEKVVDKVRIQELKANAYFSQALLQQALDAGLAGLRMVGVKFPKKTRLPHILASVMKTKLMLKGRDPDSLLDLPEATDPEMLLAMRILIAMSPIVYWLKDPILPLTALKLVQLSLKYGNGPTSSAGYALYGFITSNVLMDIEGGYKLAQMAYRLQQKRPDAKEYKAVTITVKNFATAHWKVPMKSLLKGEGSQMDAHQVALEAGRLQDAALALVNYSYFIIYSGVELEQIAKEFKNHVSLCKQMNEPLSQRSIETSFQLVLNLLGENQNPVELNGEVFQEENLPALLEQGDETTAGFAFVYKTQLAYLFEDYTGALENAEETKKYLDAIMGMPLNAIFWFYLSLTRLAMCSSLSRSEQKKFLKKVKANQKKIKLWAKHGPENYLNKYQLVEAELARVEGRDLEARELYKKAISNGAENGFIHEEALGNELYAKYWRDKNEILYAELHMTTARRLYLRWGAKSKVKHLEQAYSELIVRDRSSGRKRSRSSLGESASGTTTTATGDSTISLGNVSDSNITSTTAQTSGGAIDLGTVLKATRTMAGEIKLTKLLGTLMEIVMENAGARRGFLFLEREGALVLTALNDGEQGKSESGIALPLSEMELNNAELAVSVVRYAARTKESVVISDAAKDEKFSRDPYIEEKMPRSILCSPIINQGRLTGLIYLENNISAGAFTQQRLEVLNMLSSQAAVSLENAVLYDNMEAKVEERTKEVKDILTNVMQGIFTINSDYCLTGGYSGMVPKIFESIEFQQPRPVQMKELVGEPKLEEYLELLFTSPYISQVIIRNANPIKEYDYVFPGPEGKDVLKKLSFSFSRIFETDSEGRETKTVQKLMVVVDDRTDEFEKKQELEQKAQEQAGKVEKLYQILQLEPGIFSNFISESLETLEQVRQKLAELGDEPGANQEILRVIYREVHTLKGNARAVNLDSIGKTAHELEDVFDELQENPENVSQELKDKTNAAVDALKDEIQDGNSLFEKILNMQSSLQSAPKAPVDEFAHRFLKIVEKESGQAGKDINFEFKNELSAPPRDDLLGKLKNPLSHIVRNSVSHGIEDAEIRKNLQKPEQGRIQMRLSQQEGKLIIIIQDDGGGLDTDKIRKKALEMGLYSESELAEMTDREVAKLIFSSGLSTKSSVTDSAGRGVGMDAVREDLKDLNAVIGVSFKRNQYMKFMIRIPEA